MKHTTEISRTLGKLFLYAISPSEMNMKWPRREIGPTRWQASANRLSHGTAPMSFIIWYRQSKTLLGDVFPPPILNNYKNAPVRRQPFLQLPWCRYLALVAAQVVQFLKTQDTMTSAWTNARCVPSKYVAWDEHQTHASLMRPPHRLAASHNLVHLCSSAPEDNAI
jgi:hypothetical protein